MKKIVTYRDEERQVQRIRKLAKKKKMKVGALLRQLVSIGLRWAR